MHIGLEKKGWPSVWHPLALGIPSSCVPLGSTGFSWTESGLVCSFIWLGSFVFPSGSLFQMWLLTCSLKRILFCCCSQKVCWMYFKYDSNSCALQPPTVASQSLTRAWANHYCRSWEGIDMFVSLANCNVSWEIICSRCSKGHLWNSYLSPIKSWESLWSFKGRN